MTTKLFFLQKSVASPTELQSQDIKIHLLEGNIQYTHQVSVYGNQTHPGGLHSFLPGGSSSRLFKGTIPIAACMIVMNFLNFIF